MRRLLLWLLWGVVGLGVSAYAQSKLQITANIQSPLPARPAEWERNPRLITINVHNPTTTHYSGAYIYFSLYYGGEEVLASLPNPAVLPRFDFPAQTTVTLRADEAGFTASMVRYSKDFAMRAARSGCLPQGTYRLCMTIYDRQGRVIGQTVPCILFSIMWPTPPRALLPMDDARLAPGTLPLFQWRPVLNVPEGVEIGYLLRIAPRYAGQTLREAIEVNPPILERLLTAPYYQYQEADPPLDDPRAEEYVWQVEAVNATGKAAPLDVCGALNMKTTLRRFAIQRYDQPDTAGDGSLRLWAVWPVEGDTIPWRHPLLTVRFGPYSDALRGVVFDVELESLNGKVRFTNHRTLRWPSGPAASQGVDSERAAVHILTQVDDAGNFLNWSSSLARGRSYRWRATARFQWADGRTSTVSTNWHHFTLGLRLPQRRHPALDAVYPSGEQVSLRWAVSPPQALTPTPPDLLSIVRGDAMMHFPRAAERIRVVVAQTPRLDSIIYSHIRAVPAGGYYVMGDECEELFSPQEWRTPAIYPTGTYYWQVQYLKDGEDIPYARGPVWRFQVADDSAAAEGCLSASAAAPIGRVTDNTPMFRVHLRPAIRPEGVRSVRLRIWRKDSSESIAAVLGKTPVLDRTFRRSEALLFADNAGGTLMTIAAVNGPSDSIDFEMESGNIGYVWQATIETAPDSIRRDGRRCDSTHLTTSPARFRLGATSSECSCIPAALPTDVSPASDRIRAGDTLRIGHFNLIIDDVQGRGRAGNLSGNGRIPLKFVSFQPTVYLEVEFSGLKVNHAKEIYEGTVRGRHTTTPLGDRLSQWLETGDSPAQSEIRQLNQWLNDHSSQQISERTAALRSFRLPVGIYQEIGDRDVVIGITDAVFTPRQANVAITAWIEVPAVSGPGHGLGVTVAPTCLMPQGLGGNETFRLTEDIPLGEGWTIEGGTATLDSGTYVEFYCGGLRAVQLLLRHRMPRDVMLPLQASGEVDPVPSHHVEMRFQARWEAAARGTGSGWIFTGGMADAAIAANPAFKLRGRGRPITVLLDLSSASNPPAMTFPAGYPDSARGAGWMGISIPEARLELPPLFQRPEGPTRLGVRHVIIDNALSLTVYGHNVIRHLDLAQWGGTLDTFRFSMVRGSIREARASGKIFVPISDEPLDYLTLFQRHGLVDSAVFVVDPRDSLRFPIAGNAHLILDSTSIFNMQLRNGKLAEVTAYLTGTFSLSGQVGNIPGLSLRGIRFERVGWTTEVTPGDPPTYRHIPNAGTWSFASPPHRVGDFPISIDGIDFHGPTLRGGEMEVGLGIAASVHLIENLGGTGSGLSGGTELSFWGGVGYDPAERRLRPRFSRVTLDSIGLDADLGVAQVRGHVRFYSLDATYGNGFRGRIDASIAEMAEGEAVIQFGTKGRAASRYRYWYVDAALRFPAGIAAGPVAFYGFGGGAWYNMRVEPVGRCSPPTHSTVAGPNPGGAASCYRFVPTGDGSMGLKAATTLGAPGDPRSYNGDLALSASFNPRTGGGFERADLTGDFWMVSGGNTPLEGLSAAGRDKAPMWGNARLTLAYAADGDERTPVFDGNFAMQVAVPRNNCMLCGNGRVSMHFGPDAWFIWIGRPWSSGTPIQTELRIGDITLARTQTYFQMGSQLDPPPPIPEEVLNITGGTAHHPMRMPSLLAAGGGLALGQQLDFNTGRLEFLMFYGRLRLLTGYDMTIRKLNRAVECAGISPVGMNGWYGMGQLYAYAAADLGMFVDLWFYEGEVEILSCEAGAALQAGMPNPTWMKGAVGGRFSALGGLVEGDVNFRFTLGQECRPPYRGPFTQPLITQVMPDDGEADVDVMTTPQAAFFFPINTPFEIEEPREVDGEVRPIIHRYRVVLDQMALYESDGSAPLPGEWTLADEHSALLTPRDMLRPRTRHRLRLHLYAEEYDFARRRWQPARQDGRTVEESKTVRFTTGDGPKEIPAENIEAAYPGEGQRFVLADETPEGYIRLRRGMPHLLSDTARTLHVRLTPPNGDATMVSAAYHPTRKTLTFPLSGITTEQIYALQVISKRKENLLASIGDRAMVDRRVTTPTQIQRVRLVSGQDIFISRHTLPHARKKSGERILYAYYFGTSRYRTLREKLDALFNGVPARILAWGHHWMGFDGRVDNPPEWFDRFDLQGGRLSPSSRFLRGAVNWREGIGRLLHERIYQDYYAALDRHRLPGNPRPWMEGTILSISPVLSPLNDAEVRQAFLPEETAMASAQVGFSGGALAAVSPLSAALLQGALTPPAYSFSSAIFLYAQMDRQRLLAHLGRLLREDEFIRIFERKTGHAWHRGNRLRRMRIAGHDHYFITDARGHTHALADLAPLNPADFPRRLGRKLPLRERRRMLAWVRRHTGNQPLLTAADLRRHRHVLFNIWTAPAEERPTPGVLRPRGRMTFQLNLPR